jgi:hypothetical protein
MRDETKMDVYTSGVTGAEYDAGMKQLMSNKEIIIPILQMTVPEFKTCSQEEILQCLDISSITKDDFVSDIPNVEKDLRLTKEDSELSSLVEKLVRFDIRFKIINPKLSTEKIRVNLHIDMEAQKSYRPSNPSYPILKRAVYYVARDLSSQLSTITQTTDYSKLEKCYSIWICAEDVPKKLQNTLTEYSFSKKDIIGVADEPEEDYDLLTIFISTRKCCFYAVFRYLSSDLLHFYSNFKPIFSVQLLLLFSFLLKRACINRLSLPMWNDLRVSALPVGLLHFHNTL